VAHEGEDNPHHVGRRPQAIEGSSCGGSEGLATRGAPLPLLDLAMHPKAFLTGLAHLYNLVPYQRQAQHAGRCGVEGEGGRVPTHDWFLNLQILTSGGFR
jgi:hypothetical protein